MRSRGTSRSISIGMTLQSLHPACDVLVVATARFVGSVDHASSFFESRHRYRIILSQRITTLRYSGPVIRRLLTSPSQAYKRKSSQPDILPTSVDGDTQDP